MSANIGGKLIEKYGYFIPFNLTLTAYIISSILYIVVVLPLEKRKWGIDIFKYVCILFLDKQEVKCSVKRR